MPIDERDFYEVKATQAVHAERLNEFNRRFEEFAQRTRALELKWYGVVAALGGALFIMAKLGGWV